MASGLYEILQIDKQADPDQVKKAYRKRALQTHPDRLPQNATAEEKERATEDFRKVNNAYEILSDATKRELYDRHGVWPPPDAQADSSSRPMQSEFNTRAGPGVFTHPNLFFTDPFFTDPFRIFEAFFGRNFAFPHDYDTRMRGPFFDLPGQHRYDPFPMMGMLRGPTYPLGGSLFDDLAFGDFPRGGSTSTRVFSSRAVRGTEQGWIEESESTSTRNGITTSVKRRIDANGDEYVTYTNADGTKRHTLNGVDHDGSYPAHIGGSRQPAAISPSSSRPPPQTPPPPVIPQISARPPPLGEDRRRARSSQSQLYQELVPGASQYAPPPQPPPPAPRRDRSAYDPYQERSRQARYHDRHNEPVRPGYDGYYTDPATTGYDRRYEQPVLSDYAPRYDEPRRSGYDPRYDEPVQPSYNPHHHAQPQYAEPPVIPPHPGLPDMRNEHPGQPAEGSRSHWHWGPGHEHQRDRSRHEEYEGEGSRNGKHRQSWIQKLVRPKTDK